ncbi:MAG: GAF domain-containing protein [Chloroflexi bacterium]|nr:GAF domain-containing protein [Chloroflexota bacterium]
MRKITKFFQLYPEPLRDLGIVVLVALTAFVLAYLTGFAEMPLRSFVQDLQLLPLRGGLFVLAAAILFGIAVFAVRRWRQVARAEQQIREMVENAPVGVFLCTPEGRFLMANSTLVKILGYASAEELLAAARHTAQDIFVDPAKFGELVRQFDTTDVVQNFQTQLIRCDGAHIWCLCHVRAVRDARGALSFLQGDLRDITASKESEIAYRNLVDHSLEGISIFQNGRYVLANRAASELFGCTPQELLALTPEQTLALVHPDDRAAVFQHVQDRLAGKNIPARFIFQIVRNDGTPRWLEANASLIEYHGAPAILFLSVDVTERKHAQDEMQVNLLRTSILQDLSIALVRAGADLEAVANGVARVAAGALGDAAVVALVSEDGATLAPTAFGALQPERQAFLEAALKGARLPVAHSILERLVAHGEALWLPTLDAEMLARWQASPYRDYIQRFGMASYLGAPICHAGRVLGTLEVLRARGGAAYTADDQLLLQGLADRSAPVIVKAQLVNQAQTELNAPPQAQPTGSAAPLPAQALASQAAAWQARRDAKAAEQVQRAFAEALRDAAALLNRAAEYDQVLEGILETVARIVPYETATVYLREREQLRVARARGFDQYGLGEWIEDFTLPLALPKFQTLVKSGTPLVIPDTAAYDEWFLVPETRWIRSHIAVPIRVGAETVGMICLDSATPGEYQAEHGARLTAFADLAAAALHNAELLQQTERRAQQLSLLYDVGLTLNRVLDARTQLEFLFQIARRTLRADRMAFFRYNPNDQTMVFEVGIGMPDTVQAALAAHPLSVARGEGLTGWVAQQRLPALVADIRTDTRWLGTEDQVRSAVAAPVEHENELRGVLEATSFTPSAFNAQDERMMMLFANQVAAAMELTRLFHAQARRQHELEILRQANLQFTATFDRAQLISQILDCALRLVAADNAHFYLYEDDQLAFGGVLWADGQAHGEMFIPRPDGLTYAVARSGSMRVIDNVNADPLFTNWRWGGAIVGLPLRRGDQVRAVLNVALEHPHQFDSEELRALQLLVDQAAIALENVRNYAETQRQLRDAQLLHRAGAALNRTFSFALQLERLADFFMEAVGVDACCISTIDPTHHQLIIILDRDPIPDARVPAGTTFDLSEVAYLAAFLKTQKTLILHRNQPNLDPGIADNMDSYYWKSVLVLPLLAGQETIGIVELADQHAHHDFSADVVRLAESLAYQAASALQNARLFETLNRRAQELALLNQIARRVSGARTLDELGTIIEQEIRLFLPADAFYFALYNAAKESVFFQLFVEGAERLEPFECPLGPSLTRHVIRSHKTLRLDDFTRDAPPDDPPQLVGQVPTRAWLGAPMRLGERVIGIISLQSTQPQAYDIAQEQLLQTIADQVAVAVERVREAEALAP